MSADLRAAWERRYAEEGGLWRGREHAVPGFPPGSRVLDIGCGNGKSLLPLAAAGFRVTGVDFSKTAIELCGHALARRGLSAELFVADAVALPFHDASFDAILMSHVLGHLLSGQRGAALSEARRVLKPLGRGVVRVFSIWDMRFGEGDEIEPGSFLRGNGIMVHYFTQEELADELGGAGLRPLSVQVQARRQLVGGRRLRREEILAEVQRPE